MVVEFVNEGFVLPTKVDPCFKLFAKKLGLETKVDHRDSDFDKECFF